MSRKRALITGITGQDGSYLAELLEGNGYEVHGLARVVDEPDLHPEIARVLERVHVHRVALDDPSGLDALARRLQPHECYHLAAHSTVTHEAAQEISVIETNVSGTLRLLGAISEASPQCRFCFAASSEIFGAAETAPQTEEARRQPRSVYGISKLSAFELVRYYRQARGLFAASAIFYNHESPRRGVQFVTRKITRGVAMIRSGAMQELHLGSLEARRDWGYAPEYMDAMWRMLQAAEPRDYVIATGSLHSVRDFVELAFSRAGLDWTRYVHTDPAFVRADPATPLVGDASKAARDLDWVARKRFEEIVEEMVAADCALVGHPLTFGN